MSAVGPPAVDLFQGDGEHAHARRNKDAADGNMMDEVLVTGQPDHDHRHNPSADQGEAYKGAKEKGRNT